MMGPAVGGQDRLFYDFNLEDRIPTLMAEAGFADPEQTAHRATIFGRIACFRGSRPL